MVSSLCWVSRGHAKAVIDAHEMDEEELNEQNKMSSKIKKKA